MICTCFASTSSRQFSFALQIEHMMAFIEQEAKEKVEEIDAKVIRKENDKLISLWCFNSHAIEENCS